MRSLEESESKYALLTTLLPDGLMMVENDFIISANPSAARLLGFDDAQNCSEKISPDCLLMKDQNRIFIAVGFAADRKTLGVLDRAKVRV